MSAPLGRIFVIRKTGETSTPFPLRHREITLGRDLACHIRVQLASVALQHAKLSFDANNQAWLKAVAPTGTTLNGMELGPDDQPKLLSSGDVFSIGERKFRFEYNETITASIQKAPSAKSTPVKKTPVKKATPMKNTASTKKSEKQLTPLKKVPTLSFEDVPVDSATNVNQAVQDEASSLATIKQKPATESLSTANEDLRAVTPVNEVSNAPSSEALLYSPRKTPNTSERKTPKPVKTPDIFSPNKRSGENVTSKSDSAKKSSSSKDESTPTDDNIDEFFSPTKSKRTSSSPAKNSKSASPKTSVAIKPKSSVRAGFSTFANSPLRKMTVASTETVIEEQRLPSKSPKTKAMLDNLDSFVLSAKQSTTDSPKTSTPKKTPKKLDDNQFITKTTPEVAKTNPVKVKKVDSLQKRVVQSVQVAKNVPDLSPIVGKKLDFDDNETVINDITVSVAQEEPVAASSQPSLPQTPGSAKKSVSFGPNLSPEIFDKCKPVSTPVRRGRAPTGSPAGSAKKMQQGDTMLKSLLKKSTSDLNAAADSPDYSGIKETMATPVKETEVRQPIFEAPMDAKMPTPIRKSIQEGVELKPVFEKKSMPTPIRKGIQEGVELKPAFEKKSMPTPIRKGIQEGIELKPAFEKKSMPTPIRKGIQEGIELKPAFEKKSMPTPIRKGIQEGVELKPAFEIHPLPEQVRDEIEKGVTLKPAVEMHPMPTPVRNAIEQGVALRPAFEMHPMPTPVRKAIEDGVTLNHVEVEQTALVEETNENVKEEPIAEVDNEQEDVDDEENENDEVEADPVPEENGVVEKQDLIVEEEAVAEEPKKGRRSTKATKESKEVVAEEPKKRGRGRKALETVEPVEDSEPVAQEPKKRGRGRKAAAEQAENAEVVEESTENFEPVNEPVVEKRRGGRSKKTETVETPVVQEKTRGKRKEQSNEEPAPEAVNVAPKRTKRGKAKQETEEPVAEIETASEVPTRRGRSKASTKDEPVVETKTTKTTSRRGKAAKQEVDVQESVEEAPKSVRRSKQKVDEPVVDEPKPARRVRGAKKVEVSEQDENQDENTNIHQSPQKPVTKGRRAAAKKPIETAEPPKKAAGSKKRKAAESVEDVPATTRGRSLRSRS